VCIPLLSRFLLKYELELLESVYRSRVRVMRGRTNPSFGNLDEGSRKESLGVQGFLQQEEPRPAERRSNRKEGGWIQV
jgi:hypothetical protein